MVGSVFSCTYDLEAALLASVTGLHDLEIQKSRSELSYYCEEEESVVLYSPRGPPIVFLSEPPGYVASLLQPIGQ